MSIECSDCGNKVHDANCRFAPTWSTKMAKDTSIATDTMDPRRRRTEVGEGDPVWTPNHYQVGGKFEVIDILMAAYPDDPLMWQVGKYTLRYDKKGKPLEDLKKALFYLEMKIAQLEAEDAGTP